ncbi:MT21E methyltransferase, partial [Oxylabes madagascariensis]|nr:MT21E methyltransferase [Oxylabes madagascariensis]
EDEQIVAEIMGRRFFPNLIAYKSWEGFRFAGHEIRITEATDCYGAVVWPSVQYFCTGTGLVSIVASLLGAFVTATDLPELLGNLQHNVLQNTKQKCKHQPCVKELSWGIDLEKNFPRSSCHFDYIMAADVVYYHPFLDELLLTFDHLCKNDTVILWAMKFRLENENRFVDRFQTLFDLEMISSFPSLNIALYKAMRKGRMKT